MKRPVLRVALDEPSRRRVAALAEHPVLRADHVTLVFGVPPSKLEPSSVPSGWVLGARVSVQAVSLARDERVQALVVEASGSSRRPHDGGVLHVTVSRAAGARSSDANQLLERTLGEPITLELWGVVEWTDYAHDDSR